MEHEVIIDIGVFFCLFTVFAVSERTAPKVSLFRPVIAHWVTHFSITIINTMILQVMLLAFPFLAVGSAFDAVEIGWGLFNVLDWPLWIEILLSFLILDIAIFAQHLIAHKVHIFGNYIACTTLVLIVMSQPPSSFIQLKLHSR